VCVCVCVCLVCVCLSVHDHISELYFLSSPIFLCMLPMAVARSFSGGVVIRYVLPVLWMTSYLNISHGLNVAVQLKCIEHAALGLAINCAQ